MESGKRVKRKKTNKQMEWESGVIKIKLKKYFTFGKLYLLFVTIL